MKFWIVMQGSHEDKWPVAVFSTKELAQAYVQRINAGTGHETLWIPDEEGFELNVPRFPGI